MTELDAPGDATPPPAGASAECDDFYVGYHQATPARYARFVRRVVVVLVAVAGLLALSLAALQAPFDLGSFDYADESEATGVVRARPAPRLVVETPRAGAPAGVLLVRPWKHGAGEDAAAFEGRRVSLRGHRIASPEGEMLELVPGSIVDRGEAATAERRESLGRFRLRGELVDAKCYLGAMKPGRGKPHRSCAARCLSGGIPALFLVEDDAGERVAMMVAMRDGSPLPASLLARVAEPVELEGEVERVDGRLAFLLDRRD
jgi:hypothetical protein